MSKRGFFVDILSVAGTKSFNSILKFALGVIIARALGPEGKGMYAFLITVPTMIISLAELGVRRATIYHIGKKIHSAEKIISVLSFFLIFTSIVGIIITYSVFSYDDTEIPLSLMIVTLLTIPVRLINKYTRGILIGKEQFKRSNKLAWIPNFLNLFSVVLFVIIFQWSVLGAILSLLISNTFVGFFAVWIVAKDHKISISFDYKIIKSLLELGLVYAVAIFLVKLNFRIDILLLKYLSTTTEVGFYNQGVSVAERWQAPFALGAVILSRSANTENQDVVHNQIARLFRMTVIIGILAASVVYFISPYFVPFVYGEAFTPSVRIVQYILPAVVLVIMAKILASRLAGLQKTYIIILLYLPALIINIILNLILIPKYQAMGAVYSTNVSYTISFIGMVIIYSRIIKRPVFDLFKFRKSDFDFIFSVKQMIVNKLTGKPQKRKKIKQKRVDSDEFSFDDADF